MKLRIATVLFLTLIAFSCKKEGEKQQEASKEVNQEIDKDLIKVSFDLIVKENDNMHLYYTEDGSINFDEKNSIWTEVKGSENVQTVLFKLPKDVLPTHLRIDFGYGKNEKQSDLDLKNFKIEYLDKNFEVKDNMIFNYFYENKENTIRVSNTAILKRKDKSQESGPMIYPHIALTEELNKIIKQ
jgi:hypothetical protein